MKYKKIISAIITFTMIFMIGSCVYAEKTNFMDVFKVAKNFTKSGETQDIEQSIADLVNPLTSIIVSIGTAIIIGLGIVCGINFITGGADKQAESKKQAIGLLVSAVVLWGCFGIWELVYTTLDKVAK